MKYDRFYSRYSPHLLRLMGFLLLLFYLLPVQAMASEICTRGLNELNGSFGVIESKGGIWGYLEKSPSLRDKSVLGLQTDSALKQLVVRFENLCSDGKTPTGKLFGSIQDLLSRGRMLFNVPADRMPTEQVLEKVAALKKDADKLLASLPQ